MKTKTKKSNSEYKNAKNFLTFLIKCFYKACVNSRDKKLLKFLFSPNPTQEQLDALLNVWDIEAEGATNALFLAHFMRENQNLNFSEYVKPRLEGLLNYYRFKNIKNLDYFSKIIKLLNKNSIKPILTGDVAFKFATEEIINISTTELIVDEKSFNAIPAILKSSNFTFKLNKKKKIICSETETKDFQVNITTCPDLDTQQKLSLEFVNNLSQSPINSTQDLGITLPNFENQVFIEMVNLAKNIKFNLGVSSVILSLFKINNYINHVPDFDWNYVIDKAKKTKTGVHIKLAVMFIDDIMPNFIPTELCDENLFKEEIIRYHELTTFRRIYNEEIRPRFKRNTIFFVIKSIICVIIEYFYAKLAFIEAKTIKNNPKRIKKYLNKRNSDEIKRFAK